MKKIFILILFFYILVLIQTSFLIFFGKFFQILNLVLISVILINLFEKPKNHSGFFSAFIGGLFLDIFSERFFGFWILILIAIAIFIKFLLRKYVRLTSPLG